MQNVYSAQIKHVIQSWNYDHLGKANTNKAQTKTQKIIRRNQNQKATLFSTIKNKRGSMSPRKV